MEKIEETAVEFGMLIDEAISGVPDVDLALRVGQAKNLFDKLELALNAWQERVREECLRQDSERREKLASVGLGVIGTPATPGKKRGRKPKSESVVPAALDEGDEEALLDAEVDRGSLIGGGGK